MSNTIDLGNLYDLNKTLISKYNLPINKPAIKKIKQELIHYFFENNNSYYMLLCNEKKDYTVFRLTNRTKDPCAICAEEVLACLSNRGEILLIEAQDNGAYECWVRDNENSVNMYALFPYDAAVIEC